MEYKNKDLCVLKFFKNYFKSNLIFVNFFSEEFLMEAF